MPCHSVISFHTYSADNFRIDIHHHETYIHSSSSHSHSIQYTTHHDSHHTSISFNMPSEHPATRPRRSRANYSTEDSEHPDIIPDESYKYAQLRKLARLEDEIASALRPGYFNKRRLTPHERTARVGKIEDDDGTCYQELKEAGRELDTSLILAYPGSGAEKRRIAICWIIWDGERGC
ncbi:hypothetical protein M011DRAFT_224721 [Sporormia fimetaria CBS 119925]|uniref:Uncharacterized protein n=1 Tax=Sporormia fimetaria CBS 119925 TaxID=1340428 RepID=A0A6A6UYI2_9PLEO|nr:hypothetical protein M011DRAFT_224721 [Sporormia fimetaria CBS 119925]